MKQLFRRFSQFSFGTILGSLLSLIQVPILTYLLLPQEYGKAGLFRTLVTQIPVFLYLGMDQSYTREYHSFEDKKYLMQNSILVPLINGFILILISLLFGDEISHWIFKTEEYNYIIFYGSIFVLFIIVERFILLSIRMQEKAKEYSMFTLLTKISSFIISMSLIVLGMKDFKVIVYGLLFGQVIIDIFLIARYKNFMNLKSFSLDIKLIKALLLFGFPQMIATTLTSTLNTVDNIALNNYNNSSALGIYNASLTIVSIIGILRTAFTTFWLPTAYKWKTEEKSITHYKFISDFLLLFLTISFYIFLFIKPFIMAIIGENYSNVEYIIGLMTLPHILATLSETTTLGILYSRKTYLNIIVGIVTFLSSVLLNVYLTPKFGYRGAAISSAVAYFIFYLSRTYFSKTTGFYFSQIKHICSVLLLFSISLLHSFEIPYIGIITLLFFVLTVLMQKSTFKDIIEIKNKRGEWDFS